MGTLKAPISLNDFPTLEWVVFKNLNGFNLPGLNSKATLDAQGQESWSKAACYRVMKCHNIPTVSLKIQLLKCSNKNYVSLETIFRMYFEEFIVLKWNISTMFDSCRLWNSSMFQMDLWEIYLCWIVRRPMLAFTSVRTLISLVSTFIHLGLAQTLKESPLVIPITLLSLAEQLELVMTVSPLDLAAPTYLCHLYIVVQVMESGCILV